MALCMPRVSTKLEANDANWVTIRQLSDGDSIRQLPRCGPTGNYSIRGHKRVSLNLLNRSRDRATTTCNRLILNGVRGHRLMREYRMSLLILSSYRP